MQFPFHHKVLNIFHSTATIFFPLKVAFYNNTLDSMIPFKSMMDERRLKCDYVYSWMITGDWLFY